MNVTFSPFLHFVLAELFHLLSHAIVHHSVDELCRFILQKGREKVLLAQRVPQFSSVRQCISGACFSVSTQKQELAENRQEFVTVGRGELFNGLLCVCIKHLKVLNQ